MAKGKETPPAPDGGDKKETGGKVEGSKDNLEILSRLDESEKNIIEEKKANKALEIEKEELKKANEDLKREIEALKKGGKEAPKIEKKPGFSQKDFDKKFGPLVGEKRSAGDLYHNPWLTIKSFDSTTGQIEIVFSQQARKKGKTKEELTTRKLSPNDLEELLNKYNKTEADMKEELADFDEYLAGNKKRVDEKEEEPSDDKKPGKEPKKNKGTKEFDEPEWAKVMREGMSKDKPGKKEKEKTEYEKMSEDEKARKQGEAMEDWIKRNGGDAEKKEPGKEESDIEKLTLEELLAQVNSSRTTLIEIEKRLNAARKNRTGDSGILELEYEKAENNYRNLVARYAKALYEEKVKYLESQGLKKGTPEYEEALARMRCDIFNNTVVDAQDALAKERFDSLEQRKRTWFRKLLEKYNSLSTTKKVLIGAGVVTAGMVTVGGASIGAAALFGAGKFVRGLIGAKVGAFTGGMVKSIFGRRVEQYRTNEMAAQGASFGSRMEGLKSVEDWRRSIQDYNRMYENTVREVNRRHRNITLWATGAGIAAGGATAYMAGPALESWFPQKPPVGQVGSEFYDSKNGYAASPGQSGASRAFEATGNMQDNYPPSAGPLHGTETMTPDQATSAPDMNQNIPSPEQPAVGPDQTAIETTSDVQRFDEIQHWAAGKFNTLRVNDLQGLKVSEVLDPKFVGEHPEVSGPGWNDLNDKIDLRNEVLRIMQNKMNIGERASFANSSVYELFSEKL